MRRPSFQIALKRLNDYLKSHGLRPSPVREEVLRQVCLLPQPFLADQLKEKCLSKQISTGTIYNALNVFVLAQILHANNRHRGQASTEYELITDRMVRMQIICEKCGRISDFQDKALERLIAERPYSNLNMQHFSLFVYGECRKCPKRKTEKNNNL